MKTRNYIGLKTYLTLTRLDTLCIMFSTLFFSLQLKAQQAPTAPQVPFLQRTATATPAQTVYNIKGDFTMLGNTNLTLSSYGATTDNESNQMKYVDVDGDSNTLNSSMATLELSNGGENSATQNCSTVIFAGLYWTGKSDDANETFSVTNPSPMEAAKNVTHNSSSNITNTNYKLTITRGGISDNYFPIYTFTNSFGTTYSFSYTNANGANKISLSINGGASTNIPSSYTTSGANTTATFDTPYPTAPDGTVLKINSLTRNSSKILTEPEYQDPANSKSNVQVFELKNYNKKVVSLKGPGATTYTTITGNTEIRFPGTAQSGIFVGYQEITDYVKTHGPGAYTVADIALKEGTNSNPGLSGGWVMVIIYENPVMKSRAVTLFDGYAFVNGQLAPAAPYTNQGEYGNIDISGFTTVGTGPVNMKLGVMAAEGDVALTGDYLAVQKLNADPTVYPGNYSVLSHAGNTTTNFFNSSIFPLPTAGNSNPNLANNTGVDFSMFTVPNTGNLVIGNNQTSTTFRFGSSSDVFTIFGFAMSVDAYIPEPKGLISVNSINNVTNPPVLNALPGQVINYSLDITNEGTEATNNTIIAIPIPATAIFNTGATITYNTYNGFTTGNVPYFDSGTNKIIWNLGTLPITANHPEYVYADLSFTLNVTSDCDIILSAGCSPEVSLETGTITGTGAVSGASFAKYFFQGYDETACQLPIDGSIKVAIDASSCLSSMAGPDRNDFCGGELVTLGASTAKTGSWSIVSGPAGGGEVFSDNASPSSTFYSPNLGAYTLRWTTSCSTTDDVIVTFALCNVVNFDGTDDHINFSDNFHLNSGSFSIETWIKSNAANVNTQTILSKHLSPSSNDGYDLRLVNNLISFNWNNNSIIATHSIDTNRWYHIAVTFDGTNYKLYIDGILDKTASGSNPIPNSVDFILGAMSQNTNTPYNYYNGYADELRMWNVSLTVDQIRQMMNQEIINDGGNVKGAVVPKNISGLSWTNLAGYYQMNEASDISNGYLVDKSGNTKNGKLKGIYIQEPDTAPLPYTSGACGAWETDNSWTHFDVWDVPNSLGVDGTTKIDWNIVRTSHNITSNGDKILLGLLVNSNTLSADIDSKIEVSSYLKLDGKIDLIGKSQLLQTIESDLEVTSEGSIERDQQGQTSIYNYNYWCSPVSPINTVANNTDYTVTGMLKDGTSSTPQNINWIGGYDGSPTDPSISLARYWLYTFDNYINEYAYWNQIVETTPIRVGQGFTLKGSGAGGLTQNYTFTGKPNNGTIVTNTVASDQLLLTGNPYPSALNADAFILDNSSSIDGTLYFWEHYATNNTHILRQYQGGYAVRNLTGGTAIPTSEGIDYISGLGSPSRGIPNQYIPVGQGFFVIGKLNGGGTVTFNNGQRGFYKEDDAIKSNVMFKTANPKIQKPKLDNDNDAIGTDTFMKIRLGINSNDKYHRQVLLGFMNENATSGMDYGYDALNIDDFPNDMCFLVDENELVIQGVSFFDANASFPIGVKTNMEGNVSFVVDGLENFAPEQAVYIHDKVTDTYHNIRLEKFEVNMPIGVSTDRFSLRFTDKTLKVEEHAIQAINIRHIQNGNTLFIHNKLLDVNVEKVTLFNILGQSINTWRTENQEQQNIQIKIKSIDSGVYIAKLKTSEGEEISKKVIVFDD